MRFRVVLLVVAIFVWTSGAPRAANKYSMGSYAYGCGYACTKPLIGTAYQYASSNVRITNVIFVYFASGPSGKAVEFQAGCVDFVNEGKQEVTSVAFTWLPSATPKPFPPLIVKGSFAPGVLQFDGANIMGYEDFSRPNIGSQCALTSGRGAYVSKVTYADGTTWTAPNDAPSGSVAELTSSTRPGFPESNYDICIKSVEPTDKVIQACTALIPSKLPKDGSAALDVSEYLTQRGKAYGAASQLEEAIADVTNALHLLSVSTRNRSLKASVLSLRAIFYQAEGDFDLALRDVDEAARLDKRNVGMIAGRGVVEFNMGQFPEALVDFREAVKREPQNIILVLWLHMTAAHEGSDDAAEFSRNTAALMSTAWPIQIVRLFRGNMTSDDVATAAATPVERCQADFYIGEWALTRGELSIGRTNLSEATKQCHGASPEYISAQAELKRLGSHP